MTETLSFGWLHDGVSLLLTPALFALLAACAIAIAEAGIACGERFYGLSRLAANRDIGQVQAIARRRLERADLLSRIPPMLGLMATIIPLGPGLAALGQGDPAKLASAVTVAFDATVLGLVAGIGGLVIGKLRRRWYEELLESLEAEELAA
ncbi:flagellar motor protein MotA [Duganella sp. FT92W]|uniref:Flagellar motor protein MotA n=1 Tax=Pseudoduganella rivuli TaxID=2666085 RepID=A0A7X2II74_9BURK|nr:MotA/TolQ/ExbB proton channel family protein [Pseudoduganella rivuli]MRV70344.1 flagellar motor protein MotA [Pseudoduganella rivuli]